MKKNILLLFSIFYIGVCYSQIHRNVQVKPFIDTTTVEFRNIYGLWENYMDTLLVYSIKSHFKIKETNESINSFWTRQDIENYPFPDLVYSVPANAIAFYPLENEYFLGFVRRDTNLFEIKTMFVNSSEELFHNTPDLIISQPVIRTGYTYKLYNKFSLLLKNGKILKRRMGNIIYYFSPLYKFNDQNAGYLLDRIKKFAIGFQIQTVPDINYLVGDNMTELYSWLGIDYNNIDYDGNMKLVDGRAFPLNNMIFSGGGGENYMHEIIHILLKGIRKGRYSFFEEGIACYFGDHHGENYQYHAKRLKRYLNENDWVDLSKSLKGYYKTDTVSHSYVQSDEKYPMNNFKFYKDDTTEFSYIIHAALCEMAFRQGGYKKVKDILKAKADNDDEFYEVIEKQMKIKREDIDTEIRKYINENY